MYDNLLPALPVLTGLRTSLADRRHWEPHQRTRRDRSALELVWDRTQKKKLPVRTCAQNRLLWLSTCIQNPLRSFKLAFVSYRVFSMSVFSDFFSFLFLGFEWMVECIYTYRTHNLHSCGVSYSTHVHI